MSTVGTIQGDLNVTGTVNQGTMTIPNSVVGQLPQANLTQRDLQAIDIPLQSLITDEATPVPLAAAAAGKLGLVRGTVGTDTFRARTVDCKSNGVVASYTALASFILPDNYVSGETVQLALLCKMDTTIADASATVDVECWKEVGDGTVGSDLCETLAQSINSLTAALKYFVITPSGLVAGNKFYVRFTISVRDNAHTGTDYVFGSICKINLLTDVKG